MWSRFSFFGPQQFLMWICGKSLFWKAKKSKCFFVIIVWCNLCCKSAYFLKLWRSVHFVSLWCVKVVVSRRVYKIVELRFSFLASTIKHNKYWKARQAQIMCIKNDPFRRLYPSVDMLDHSKLTMLSAFPLGGVLGVNQRRLVPSSRGRSVRAASVIRARAICPLNGQDTQPSHFFPLDLGPSVGGLLRFGEGASIPLCVLNFDVLKKGNRNRFHWKYLFQTDFRFGLWSEPKQFSMKFLIPKSF